MARSSYSASWLSLLRGEWLPLWIVPRFAADIRCGDAARDAAGPAGSPIHLAGRRKPARYSVTTPRSLWITTVLATLLLTAVILTAVGGRILGRTDADGDMPITVVLGAAVAWLTPGILFSAGVYAWLLWKNNPARPCRRSIHVSGDLAAALRPQVKQLLQNLDWDVYFDPPAHGDRRPHSPGRADSSRQKPFDPIWPFVSLQG